MHADFIETLAYHLCVGPDNAPPRVDALSTEGHLLAVRSMAAVIDNHVETAQLDRGSLTRRLRRIRLITNMARETRILKSLLSWTLAIFGWPELNPM
jgi:hypothetical protein